MQELSSSSSRLRPLAALLLTALLLLLAFRLTSSEFLHETLAQKIAAAAAPAASKLTVNIGPAHITLYAALTLLLSGGATLVAAVGKSLNLRHLIYFLLIALILAGATLSSFHAANRFLAIVGTADLACALLAGYALLLLIDLLGPRAKNAAIAAILAVLALGCARALLQHFVEFPDLLLYVKQHPDEALRNNGIDPNNALQKRLFLSRINSQEVSGFTSLANVFATQLIPFVGLLAALIVAAIPILRRGNVSSESVSPGDAAKGSSPSRARTATAPVKRTLDYKSKNTPQSREIQVPVLAFVCCVILLLVGLIVLPLTDSKGALAASVITLSLTVLAGVFWKHVVAWRKPLLFAAALFTLAGTALLLAYGKSHDVLPTQSLAFRWHYWSASVPIIEQHAATGVGLNNFGDYYLQFKRPSSPEDVKDPHNFFVRLASELGIPTTLAVFALLFWMFVMAVLSLAGWQALRRGGADAHAGGTADSTRDTSPPPSSLVPTLLLGAAATVLWAIVHAVFAEEPNAYNVELTIVYAIVGWAVFAAVFLLLETLSAPGSPARLSMPYIAFAAALAAAGMLLYDQVNMALVTGPVAMLFWCLLALSQRSAGGSAGGSRSAVARSPATIPAPLAIALAAVLLTAGSTALFALTVPVAQNTFPWDPTPYEIAYIQKSSAKDFPAARAALDAAISRAPNDIELRTQRISLYREELHLPVADEIRKVLELDRANAPIRISLAAIDSDLPPRERAAILRQALTLDATLPANEIKRLPAEEISQVEAKIRELDPMNQ